ncbi:MAG: hypothetical protein Q4P18_07240 [Methanobrevibacter sp.]|uniref:hypothetical protein n=1 Tax=Methanobrevibacter sp. TaxID=66852 RepID=UPI0026E09019|nr:hypothetical protein [Methanobrevibacter sp.]MDO5849312.1 hypothetical protein [Methanobrevibacter sp.]
MSTVINSDSKQYDLAELRLDDEVIPCEDFSIDLESTEDLKTATNSHDAIAYKGGKREISWEANGVFPEYYPLLKEYWKNRSNFTVSTYNFEENGEYQEADVLLHSRIEKISISQEDGRSLDISGKSLSIK